MEINKRFSDETNEILLISEVFNPSSRDYFNSKCTRLQHFINHYKYFKFNTISLESEFLTAKSFIQSKNNDKVDIYFIIKTLSQLPNAFIETLKICTILLTFPVTTATNERFFLL